MVGTRLQSCNDLTLLTDGIRWAAVVEKNSRFDGSFVYSVATTGVYCRPSVRPGRQSGPMCPLPTLPRKLGRVGGGAPK
jgi:hypothetical protein